MLKIDPSTTKTVTRPVDLKEKGTFSVELKKPTWDDLTHDMDRPDGYLEARLKNSLVGWEGIENADAPFPFSWENFQTLCTQIPAVLHIVTALVSDLYYSFGEDAAKNSEPTPSDS